MTLQTLPSSQSLPGARPARGGREAPAPWGGGTGAARFAGKPRKDRGGSGANHFAGEPGRYGQNAVPDLIRDLWIGQEAPDQVRGCGGAI